MKVDGIDVNVQDSGGSTALIKCINDFKEVVLELLKLDGIDINVQENGGSTALIDAISEGLTEVVLELLKVDGIDINNQDNDRCTALITACCGGHADIALVLLRYFPRIDRHINLKYYESDAHIWASRNNLTAVVTRFEALDRGDARMPLVKIHHRYLHGDVAAEGAQAQALHPPWSAITKTLVDKNLIRHMSHFLAP